MEVGIQVSSLKPLLQSESQVEQAFCRMANMGCQWVQLQWINPSVSPESIGKWLKVYGLRCVSVQDFYETVRNSLGYYSQLNRAAGGSWMCVSRIPERLKSPDGLNGFIEELREMAGKLGRLGQKLCFHPVSGDFAAIPGMDAVEYLLANMPELSLCLDLYHLNRNCSDMPLFIRRYGSRICMVHFKDSRDGALVPAGSGDICWDGVVEACLDAGVPYGFVEQETWQGDPYLCLGDALTWLNGELGRYCHD